MIKIKKIKILILGLIMCFFMFSVFKTPIYTKAKGIGEIEFEWDREIYDGVNLRHTMSSNHNKEQKTYTIEFDPKTTKLRPVVTTGGSVIGGNTMSTLVNNYEQQGHHVVFGLNGDAYDTSNGIPLGISINDGVLLVSSGSEYGFGITEDGEVKYGNARLPMSYTADGQNHINIAHVNRNRTSSLDAVYFYTEDYYPTTNSNFEGIEVVLDVVSNHGLKIGTPHNLVVNKIVEVGYNPNGNKTEIGKKKAVLAASSGTNAFNELTKLKKGDSVTVNVNDNNDSKIDWSKIVAGMGIFHLLLDNGKETGHMTNPDIHPRSAMGIKADGSIILMQNDGRQVGWASGVSFKEMVEYMRDDLGAITVFNFDGGGSSTISATIPGNERATVLNKPSDGGERNNANALLFIATTEPASDKKAKKLHLYPSIQDNYSTKGMILENGNLSFYTMATDNNYYPTPLTSNVTYEVQGDIGTIDNAGNFKAKKGAGKGKVIASSNGMTASFDIEVVNQISKIETIQTIISVAPGKSVNLNFKASKDGIPIMLSNEALDFKLEPESLGTVSANGKLTATTGQGTGHLIVSYKDFSVSIPVEIGRMPEMILDFEEDIFTKGWSKYYTNIPANGGSGNISMNYDERFVKHGDGSLRIDYDFATKPLTGTVAIEVGQSSGTKLSGQPKAIGAWVYGDGNGGWFRIQLTGGKFVGDTRINWVGWKYIETEIPLDAPFPYTLQRAIRLLGTASIANNKKGTIYVDSLRAIYDFKNDDNNEPELVKDSLSPKEGTTTSNRQEVIKLTVKDQEIPGQSTTGINIDRTQMFINNILVKNIQQTINSDGSVDIYYNPSALDRLRPGTQSIRVRVEDNFGNKKFIEWSFVVEGYSVSITEEKPDKELLYANEVFNYKINTSSYADFEEIQFKLNYNKNNLTLLNATYDRRLTAVKEIISAGNVTYHLIGMNNLEKGETDFINFEFQVNETISGSTEITVSDIIVTDAGINYEVVLDGFNALLDYKYVFTTKGSTSGGNTLLTVTEDNKPVKDASFVIKLDNKQLVFADKTDAKGELNTSFLTDYPKDTSFKVYAIKDGFISNIQTIKIVESLGTLIPEKVSINVGYDAARSIGVSYQTNHQVKEGYIWLSTNSNLSNSTAVELTKTIIYTYADGFDKEYSSWGGYVDNLIPNTTYYYQVGSNNSKSEIFSFKTPSDSKDKTIAFYGDLQGAYNKFDEVVKELHKLYPNVDLSLLAGDVSDNGHHYKDWTNFDLYNKDHLNNGIWAATIGNHDVTDDGLAFVNYFYGPDNGIASNVGRRNYYFTIGDAIIFNFDTEAAFNSYDPSYTKQIQLLTEVMQTTDKTFKIVLMHRSVYPLRYNELEVRALAPVFEKLNIDLVLSGHDHVYSRTTMYKGTKTDISGGVTYVVGGTASGAKYYEADQNRPWLDKYYDKKNPVFMVLKLSEDDTLEFETYALELGTSVLIDSFSFSKQKINITENNFYYVGSKTHKPGQILSFKLQADLGYKISEVKVNNQVILPDEDNIYTTTTTKQTLITVTTEQYFNPYDLNNDGKVNADDALMVAKHLSKKELINEDVIRFYDYQESDFTLKFIREILTKAGEAK